MIWPVKLLGFWVFGAIWWVNFVETASAPCCKSMDWKMNSPNLLALKFQTRLAHVRPWNGFVSRAKSWVCAVVHAPDHCRPLLLSVLFSICWIYGQKFRIPYRFCLGIGILFSKTGFLLALIAWCLLMRSCPLDSVNFITDQRTLLSKGTWLFVWVHCMGILRDRCNEWTWLCAWPGLVHFIFEPRRNLFGIWLFFFDIDGATHFFEKWGNMNGIYCMRFC